ncbi:MAG: transcriptional regulator [Candidatus Aenigmatarchaeota archaeon]|nr:MAG: transcriptional regulator [Candidatus Aenigmarchaeota archaeon]
MIKTPCEILQWKFLPSLRRELVLSMIKKGMERKDIADIFDVSEAAISQYLKFKRGSGFKFNERERNEIDRIASIIAKSRDRSVLVKEMCNLCFRLRMERVFCKMHIQENPSLVNCKLYKNIRISEVID